MGQRRKKFIVNLTAILTLATSISAFTCNVCIPEVKGNKASRDLAMKFRANITRTWPNTPEKDMGECAKLEKTSKFMLECAIDDELSACSMISNDDWFALSCGRLGKDDIVGCFDKAGYKYCLCNTPLCNSPARAPAPTFFMVALTLAVSFKIINF